MSKSNKNTPDQAAIDYWNLFRDLPEAYLLVAADDPLFTIVELNKARERMTNVRREEVLGKPLFEVHPDTSEEYRKTGVNYVYTQLQQVLKTGKTKKLRIVRYDMKDASGMLKTRYWQSVYLPIRAPDGKVTHVLAATRDVTDQQLMRSQMTNAEKRLEAALSIGKVGSWVWDVEADVVVTDSNLARMFGIDRRRGAVGMAITNFIEAIHPDDRSRVQTAIRRTIELRTTFEEEYRTASPRGAVQWVLARGKVEERDGKLLFPGVIVDITERRDLQAQIELAHKQDQLNRREAKLLQERNEELEAIGRTKDEFVALASHQLRTPATAVKQYLGMVLQGYVGKVSGLQTEMLEKAFESNERQIQIINQILNAARVDTGRLAMTPVPVNLAALIRGISDEMRSAIEQRGHAFIVSLPKRDVPVMADLGYLRMAVENLLHNASIYTPEGGRIEMKLQISGKRAQLSITDNGVGIKKADLGKLFAKFSRIHNPLSVAAGGSGIGLYLTAEIVRLHGGTVSVESKIRQGTTFAILLPLEQNKPINGAEQPRHIAQVSPVDTPRQSAVSRPSG